MVGRDNSQVAQHSLQSNCSMPTTEREAEAEWLRVVCDCNLQLHIHNRTVMMIDRGTIAAAGQHWPPALPAHTTKQEWVSALAKLPNSPEARNWLHGSDGTRLDTCTQHLNGPKCAQWDFNWPHQTRGSRSTGCTHSTQTAAVILQINHALVIEFNQVGNRLETNEICKLISTHFWAKFCGRNYFPIQL